MRRLFLTALVIMLGVLAAPGVNQDSREGDGTLSFLPIPEGTRTLRLQEGRTLFGNVFPSNLLIAPGDRIDSELIEVDGFSEVVLSLGADTASSNLRVIIFQGPMPDGRIWQLVNDDIKNFSGSAGQVFVIPVRGRVMVVRLENIGFSTRRLVVGATIYAVR